MNPVEKNWSEFIYEITDAREERRHYTPFLYLTDPKYVQQDVWNSLGLNR